MTYPAGVQTATLTFSNPGTFLGHEATRTEVTFQATAGVVWSATGQPIDDFPEIVTPGDGMPGALTAPFVDQAGFTDQAGNAFTMWAYQVTRKSFFGSYSKVVKKNWQPLLGQDTIDFDNLPGGSIGLPVSTPVPPVTSVAGLTLAVGAEDLASELVPFLPDGVTPETVEANLPARLEEAALSATILTETEPLATGLTIVKPRGAKFICAGDSNTETGYSATQMLGSIAAHVMLASGGRAWFPTNAGVAGNRSDDLLARIQTDVINHDPDWCHIMIGTNDAGTGRTLASYAANMRAIIGQLQAAGIFVTVASIPPRNDSTGADAISKKRLTHTFNAWLREYLPTVGVPFIDIYSLLVNPATGGIKDEYNFGDQLHFKAPGFKVIGQEVWRVAAPYLTSAAPVLARDAADPTDLFNGQGLFLANTAGVGTGWNNSDSAHDTVSIVTGVSGVTGNVQRVTANGTAGYQVGINRFVNTGYSPGNVLELSAVLTTTQASNHGAAIVVDFPEASSANHMIRIEHDLTNGSVRRRFTVPAGVTYFVIKLLAGPGAGTTDFAQVKLQNLSTLGAFS